MTDRFRGMRSGQGDIKTTARFGPDFSASPRVLVPLMPNAKGAGTRQQRRFLQGRYEIQISTPT